MSSIEQTDRESAANATAPRVTLAHIEQSIVSRYDFTAGQAIRAMPDMPAMDELDVLSICVLVMKNGFVVIGKSAPASPENFNIDLGRKFAYEDAVKQLWPLLGYALKERLNRDESEEQPRE